MDDKNKNSGNKNTVSNSNIKAGGNVHIGDIVNIHQHISDPAPEPPKSPSEVSSMIQDLRNQVGRGKIKQVLEKMLELSQDDQDQQNTVILLSQRWNSLKREERMGVIGRSDASVTNNRITMSILDLLDELDS
ncbi:hypothetical protein [Flavilitoribacter nigricans]|uniref:Effector-associated domain-containing protein n=1 Tax=Flavilitoribacter nigricans (strain ATCC 23147 / DSM 23189 / NBRC 102662 / NCIMB 1420 / SS-2) TaxID=1122177 RepID=A0A2D0N1A9_FLAN2|nr:hypothetical protein [Flavilitoribacter nigricans]PHN02321.1 hypothetical protein CRP01_33025 [Flavilitoribacter nigricans DSM 23189 = NBRC 102662]